MSAFDSTSLSFATNGVPAYYNPLIPTCRGYAGIDEFADVFHPENIENERRNELVNALAETILDILKMDRTNALVRLEDLIGKLGNSLPVGIRCEVIEKLFMKIEKDEEGDFNFHNVKLSTEGIMYLLSDHD